MGLGSDLPKIVVLNGSCLDIVDAHREWLSELPAEIVADPAHRELPLDGVLEAIQGADAVIGPVSVAVTDAILKNAPGLKVFSLASSGFDTVDLNAATRLEIVVTNAPVQEMSEAVADMAFALMLGVARTIAHHHAAMIEGRKTRGMGTTLWKKTLGIVGLGNIGRAVARRAAGFQMRLLATDPFPDKQFVEQYDVQLLTLDELLAESDFVSLHVRICPETTGMIGKRELGLMKTTAVIINTARHDLIQEGAIADAIEQGKIRGAGLDDPPREGDANLFNSPHVIFTPHLGNRASETCDAVFRQAVVNALDSLAGRKSSYLLNPEVLQ